MSVYAPEKDPSKHRVIRQLATIELYQAALHLLDHYYGTVVTCRYALPARLAKSPENLRHALDVAVAQTVLEHPVLQVGMIDVDTKVPSYVELDEVRLARHIEWRNFENTDDPRVAYDDMLQYQLDTKFCDVETTPQWRVAVLYQGGVSEMDVFFSWNHPICDGVGGRIFHESLLHNLNHPDAAVNAVLHERVLALSGCADSLPPSMDKMADYSTSVPYILRSAWKELKPVCATRSKRTLHKWAPIVKAPPLRTQFRRLSFDDATTSKVVQSCRAHGTTLTGLFHGIVAVSLAASLRKSQAEAFMSKTAVNMRQAVTSPVPGYPNLDVQRAMGNNVSVVAHTLDRGIIASIRAALGDGTRPKKELQNGVAPMLWAIAKSARKEVAASLDRGAKNNVIGAAKFVSDWPAAIRASEKKTARDTCWVVTNLGAMDGQGDADGVDDPWCIEKANFTLCAQVAGPGINVSPIAIRGKSLSVDVTWQAATVDDLVANQLADDINAWFAYLVEV
ncbi:hypothetical protein PWT90_05266 [Aphanocladium album]|nr:hypothetical protein PWT90_05266 [Aphanocladium album]